MENSNSLLLILSILFYQDKLLHSKNKAADWARNLWSAALILKNRTEFDWIILLADFSAYPPDLAPASLNFVYLFLLDPIEVQIGAGHGFFCSYFFSCSYVRQVQEMY